MTKILPLPVKKNKFGELVADISGEKYYRQIAEEVLEVHKASIIHEVKKVMSDEGCGQCAEYVGEDNESEELVDIITCCVTRLEIMHWYEDGADFQTYLNNVVAKAQQFYETPSDFYTELNTAVIKSYHAARTCYIIDQFDSDIVDFITMNDFDEEALLGDIIVLCLDRLEKLGYDEEKRQELYQTVNEKNRKRGYLEG